MSSGIDDLEQALSRFINENDRSASALVIGRVQEMSRRRWMLGKASSSQSSIASKRLFGSSLSADCQSVFHLGTSFPRDLGNEMSFSQYAFYFIIQLKPDRLENLPKWWLQPPQPSPLDPPLRSRFTPNLHVSINRCYHFM